MRDRLAGGNVRASMADGVRNLRRADDTQPAPPRVRRPLLMEIERSLGFEPADREFWRSSATDIESRVLGTWASCVSSGSKGPREWRGDDYSYAQ